jgi:hypothetical protein
VRVLRLGATVLTPVVYYESIKGELRTSPIYECRCDERLKTKTEESTRLGYTGLIGELEHLKIKTRLIDDMFAGVMGEYVSGVKRTSHGGSGKVHGLWKLNS